jgi:hypothetical protein
MICLCPFCTRELKLKPKPSFVGGTQELKVKCECGKKLCVVISFEFIVKKISVQEKT